MKHLFLTNRFFYLFGIIIFVFLLSFPFGLLFPVAQALLVLAIAIVGIDIFLLFSQDIPFTCKRIIPKVLSLGDENLITLELANNAAQKFKLEIIDEIPVQFQKRDFSQYLSMDIEESKVIKYRLRPVQRGEYSFGNINVFFETFIGVVQRRKVYVQEKTVPVYPSILQMKQYSLKALASTSHQQGIKKIRKIGHSYEFEQIKNYVKGDDFRSINWKASSRRATLMVNQYEDERAQQVYNIIDKSRTMKMPFEGLSLIDYAINTSLVISNVALQKHDKAGLITFSDKIGTTLKAERSPLQLNKILNALYNEKERHLEANYELLYHASRKLIKGRSLIILYTNFESSYALERVLPLLRRINNLHLLVVVFFKNTEVEDFAKKEVDSTEGIYYQTVAQNAIAEKEQMIQKLKSYGIQAVLTRPENLSINSVNKYLELKSRGLI